jgi:hypothetical protein
VALAAVALPGRAAGQALRYGDEVGVTRAYVREQTDRVLQTVNARQLATEIRSGARLRAAVTAAAGDGLTWTITHDSLAVTENGQAATPDLAPLAGVATVVEMDRRGTVSAVELSDTLPEAAARFDLASTYRHFFPRLPAGEAAAGAEWADTTTATAVQAGVELRVRRVNRYVSQGWASHGERRVVRVDYETELTIEGGGEQDDAGIVLSGSGSGTGGFTFDPAAGVFVAGGETIAMRMVALVDARGQSLLVPIEQNRSVTVSLAEN